MFRRSRGRDGPRSGPGPADAERRAPETAEGVEGAAGEAEEGERRAGEAEERVAGRGRGRQQTRHCLRGLRVRGEWNTKWNWFSYFITWY